MTWEETILYIRGKTEYKELVKNAYLGEDLINNVESFRKSKEFKETLKIVKQCQGNKKHCKLLDIGCGNGISAISFGLEGLEVVALEPDPSETVGAGAVRKLVTHYNLINVTVYEAFAEDIAFESEKFDIVYARQAMHHAYDLSRFVAEAARVLKKGGLLLTIRDHVIFDNADKEKFLQIHPLQKFYGGENAFTSKEYQKAMENAGLTVLQEFKLYDSIINYFPVSKKRQAAMNLLRPFKGICQKPLLKKIIPGYVIKQINNIFDETIIPGRMYSYIVQKPL